MKKAKVSLPKSLLRKHMRRSRIFGGINVVLLAATFIPSPKSFHAQQQIFSEQKKLWPQQATIGGAVLALLKLPNRTPAENQQLSDLMKQQSSLSAQLLSYSNQTLAVGRLDLRYSIIRLIIGLGALVGFVILAVQYRRTLHRFRNGLCVLCGYDLRGSGARCSECGTVREANSEPNSLNSLAVTESKK